MSSAVTAPLRGIGPAPQHSGLPEFLACAEVAAGLAGKGTSLYPECPIWPRSADSTDCLSRSSAQPRPLSWWVAACPSVSLLPPQLPPSGAQVRRCHRGQPQRCHRPGRWGAVQGASWGESGGFCPPLEEGQGPRPALPSHVYPPRGPQVRPQTFKALSTHPCPEPAFLARSPAYRVFLPRELSLIPSPRSLTSPLLPWSPSPH